MSLFWTYSKFCYTLQIQKNCTQRLLSKNKTLSFLILHLTTDTKVFLYTMLHTIKHQFKCNTDTDNNDELNNFYPKHFAAYFKILWKVLCQKMADDINILLQTLGRIRTCQESDPFNSELSLTKIFFKCKSIIWYTIFFKKYSFVNEIH